MATVTKLQKIILSQAPIKMGKKLMACFDGIQKILNIFKNIKVHLLITFFKAKVLCKTTKENIKVISKKAKKADLECKFGHQAKDMREIS